MKFLIPLIILIGCTTGGADWQHYRISALSEAQDRGMTIFLHVHEEGNKACETQKEILYDLTRGDDFKKVAAFRVQYGVESLLENDYRILGPCTVLIFKGSVLKTRLISETDKQKLSSVLRSSL